MSLVIKNDFVIKKSECCKRLASTREGLQVRHSCSSSSSLCNFSISFRWVGRKVQLSNLNRKSLSKVNQWQKWCFFLSSKAIRFFLVSTASRLSLNTGALRHFLLFWLIFARPGMGDDHQPTRWQVIHHESMPLNSRRLGRSRKQ